MTDRDTRARRAMLLSEMLQGPAADLRSTNLDAVKNPQAYGMDTDIEALWVAVEALWLHLKKGRAGVLPDHRGPAWQTNAE